MFLMVLQLFICVGKMMDHDYLVQLQFNGIWAPVIPSVLNHIY